MRRVRTILILTLASQSVLSKSGVKDPIGVPRGTNAYAANIFAFLPRPMSDWAQGAHGEAVVLASDCNILAEARLFRSPRLNRVLLTLKNDGKDPVDLNMSRVRVRFDDQIDREVSSEGDFRAITLESSEQSLLYLEIFDKSPFRDSHQLQIIVPIFVDFADKTPRCEMKINFHRAMNRKADPESYKSAAGFNLFLLGGASFYRSTRLNEIGQSLGTWGIGFNAFPALLHHGVNFELTVEPLRGPVAQISNFSVGYSFRSLFSRRLTLVADLAPGYGNLVEAGDSQHQAGQLTLTARVVLSFEFLRGARNAATLGLSLQNTSYVFGEKLNGIDPRGSSFSGILRLGWAL